MHTTEPASSTRSTFVHRTDSPQPGLSLTGSISWTWPARLALLAAYAIGFVLWDGGSLSLGAIEARLGLAARESFAPLGRVFAGWEPTVWPLAMAPSWIWAWGEGGNPSSGAVRWPSAIAGVAIGLMLSRRMAKLFGGRTGVLVGLCWLGSLGMIDRSAGAGLDLILGFATIGAVDRILARGSDFIAGLWLAAAFLAGGWPPVAVVALATVVIGRHDSSVPWRLLLPPSIAFMGWSLWLLKVGPAEAWGAALVLPITQGPSWMMAFWIFALALPWSPLALVAVNKSVSVGWDAAGRSYVVGWLQVSAACLIVGTVVPGLDLAARMPALAGLAVAAGAVCEGLMSGSVSPKIRRWATAVAAALAIGWMMMVMIFGGYLATSVSYYRAIAIILMMGSVSTALLAVFSAVKHEVRGSLVAFTLLAISLKTAHSGYYVPEWNYRRSQGPWGRAIGQWVPPNWPIYTTHAWNTDLAFATSHPVRQLLSAHHLDYQPGEAKFVLLLESEFEHWPSNAAPLQRVAMLQDEFGGNRIVARTAGPLPWTKIKAPSGGE